MAHPTALGRYQIEAKLGEGGMAEVYLAHVAGLSGYEKRLAVKRLSPDFREQRDFVTMFLDEARIGARLTHPNIVQVFEVGETDGLPWLAMEYLDGPTLSQIQRRLAATGTLEVQRVCRLMAIVADALNSAHDARDAAGKPMNLVHRDVTLSNVVLTTSGAVKLLDFGVARADGRATRTRQGIVKGKTAYMAPEMIKGEGIDRRADIFSMGVCLYALTTAKLPFTASGEFDLLRTIVAGKLTSPRKLNRGIPRALEAVILKALAVDPLQRYQRASDMARALTAVASAPTAGEEQDLARWVTELFPRWKEDQQRRIAEGRHFRNQASGLFALTADSREIEAPLELAKDRWPLWVSGAATAVLLASGAYLAWWWHQPPR